MSAFNGAVLLLIAVAWALITLSAINHSKGGGKP